MTSGIPHLAVKPRPDLAALVPPDARRVLDIGCGGGGTGVAIKARLKDCSVIGIEPDATQAAKARERLDEVSTTVTTASLEPKSFDAILAANTLAYLDDPKPFLVALGRLLKPTGLLIIAAPAGENYESMWRGV